MSKSSFVLVTGITMDTSWCILFLQACFVLFLRVELSLSDDFDVTTIYNFQTNTEYLNEDRFDTIGECDAAGSCSWELNGWKVTDSAQTMIPTPGEGYLVLDPIKSNKLKLTPLSSTWLEDGIVLEVTSTDYHGAVLLYLSMGDDINNFDMINITIPFEYRWRNNYGRVKLDKCINYLNENYDFRRGPRQCKSLTEKGEKIYLSASKINNILIKRTQGNLEITLLEKNIKMQITVDYDLLSDIKYIGVDEIINEMKFRLWKPVKVFALTQTHGTYGYRDWLGPRGACMLVEYYLQPNSDAKLTVKMQLFPNDTEFLLGTSKANTNKQEDPWKIQMFVADPHMFHGTLFRFKIIAEKNSDSHIFIKSIKNCDNKEDRPTIDILTTNRKISAVVHARNNARGLPFLSKEGKIIDSNFAVDIETCNSFIDGCKWTLNNFTASSFHQRPPLNLQGNITTTIKAGEEPKLQLCHAECSFTFQTSQDSGTLRIYLLDSAKGLNEANMYYFRISNRQKDYYCYFYRCTNQYKFEQFITIAPGYENRRCMLIANSQFHHNYWQKQEYEFLVKINESKVSLTVKSNEDTRRLFSWTDNEPLNIQYYAVGSTELTGTSTSKTGLNVPAMVLTTSSGSIISEAFLPSSTEVCVSTVYYGPQESITFQVVESDGEKYHLSHLQTSSLGDGWLSSLYSAQLPQEKLRSPVRIELTAEAPAESMNSIAIQRIAGCNSRGLEEDIYVVPSNKFRTGVDLYAYDVAVKRSASFSEEELECLNGGLFDNERNGCICPAGFTGKTCELGCGPDRYDSKCSGRCSKTEKGCMEMKLCRPKLGCNCAPGLKGVLCDTTCSRGEYGANCEQKCGNCFSERHVIYYGDFESCDIYTGQCPLGCQEGFYPPFCQTHYKHLNTPPKIISIDYSSLQVIFSMEPDDMAGSGIPTFYQIQIRDAANQENAWKEMEPILLPTTQSVETNITQLKSGTNYELRVVLLDLDGNSYQGKNVPVVNGFTKCIVPKVDYNLNATEIGQKKFQVNWEYLEESTLWCKSIHFEVEMYVDWTWENRYEGTEKTFTFSKLLPGEKYKVRVRGIGVNGPLPFSEPLTVTTQDEVPLSVSTPKIISRTSNSIELNWKEPFSPRGKIEMYKVTYKCQKLLACNDEDCSYLTGDVEVRTPSITLQGLRPHAQYLITIAAKSASYGPDVQILATTDMGEPEISPSSNESTITLRTNSTLTVQWERPQNCTYLNGYLYGYQYELFEPKSLSPIREGSTENTSTTFVGLSPHTDYEVKVYLKTSGGKSSGHPLIINASTRATVPGKVEQLTVYKVGRRIIGLRWALPKETYGDIRSFTISYKSEHQQLTSFMVKPTPCIAWKDLYCHTINSLHPDTEYTVKVQARNKEVAEDGEIAQIVATTKESAPLAPDYIKIDSQTETSLTIEWGLPKLINGVLRSFLVNIEETDSVNITDCCQYFPIQEVAVKNEQANYKLQLKNLKPASTYAISVTAKTMALGPGVSITAHTRPSVPSMDGMLELADSGDSSELMISSSPTFNIHSTSINKALIAGYLIVVIPQSVRNSVQETTITNEWLAQELKRQINTTFYIAAELKQEDFENDAAEVALGKESDLKNGKWSLLWDPVLENKQQYRIGLVAILDYCGVLNVGYTETNILTVHN